MVEFAVLLLILGALALLIGPRLMAKRGPGAAMARGEMAHGTLLVTGVSPRPDAEGEQFVTISGVITGPTVSEHVVYQRMAVDVGNWPMMGQLIPVAYSPKNPDKWFFAPPAPPVPPVPPPPPMPPPAPPVPPPAPPPAPPPSP